MRIRDEATLADRCRSIRRDFDDLRWPRCHDASTRARGDRSGPRDPDGSSGAVRRRRGAVAGRRREDRAVNKPVGARRHPLSAVPPSHEACPLAGSPSGHTSPRGHWSDRHQLPHTRHREGPMFATPCETLRERGTAGCEARLARVVRQRHADRRPAELIFAVGAEHHGGPGAGRSCGHLPSALSVTEQSRCRGTRPDPRRGLEYCGGVCAGNGVGRGTNREWPVRSWAGQGERRRSRRVHG